MITVIINGKQKTLEGTVNLNDLLQTLKLNLRLIAVGYNGEVVSRDKYSEVFVKNGDVIDIVHPVGGG